MERERRENEEAGTRGTKMNVLYSQGYVGFFPSFFFVCSRQPTSTCIRVVCVRKLTFPSSISPLPFRFPLFTLPLPTSPRPFFFPYLLSLFPFPLLSHPFLSFSQHLVYVNWDYILTLRHVRSQCSKPVNKS